MTVVANTKNNISYQAFINHKKTSDIVQKPTEFVEKTINNTVDAFVKQPEDEEKKKSHKKSVAVASSVIVLSTLVALFNPKFSSKLTNKLKIWAHNASLKTKNSKDNLLKSKFYKSCEKFYKTITKIAESTNNFNSAKDVGFKWLCEADKFNNVKNKTAKRVLQTINNGFTKVMSVPHRKITQWFDTLGKKTVHRKFTSLNKDLNVIDDCLKSYLDKLPKDEKLILQSKLNELQTLRKYFSNSSLNERFALQEQKMSNLDGQIKTKTKKYLLGFFDKNTKLGRHIKDNTTFWAEDFTAATKQELTEQGNNAIEKLISSGNTKGKYDEIFELLKHHLKEKDKEYLETSFKEISKKMKKANYCENVEYFDKKRDLILGGAPTDILTGLFMLGLSGIAVGKADTKEERISKSLTGAFPIIAGFGVSMATAALLYSGFQGMIIGALTSFGLSQAGSFAAKKVVPESANNLLAQNNQDKNQDNKNNDKKQKVA